MGLDCSIEEKKGCNYCGRNKVINTFGDDFQICHNTEFDNDEHWIQTIDFEVNYYILHIRYCPICGKKLTREK